MEGHRIEGVRVWRITAAGSERDQRRIAGSLLRRGLVAGDRVVFTTPSSAELLAAALGALRVGIVPTVLNPTLLPAERDQLIADAEPALVVATEAALAGLVDGPAVELAPVPLARPMHYTSGTTGRPKGVWSGVLDDAAAAALFADERDLWQFAPDDVLLVCSPLHHSAPLRFSAGALLSGGTVVLVDRFDAPAVAEAIAAHRPTAAFLVPAHLQRLFAAAESPPLDSFRLMAHAGAPCPPGLKRRALDLFPAGSVWEFYGSTEGQFTVCSSAEWEERPGTVGRARAHRRIEIDGAGQIWCHAPAWARFSYWRDPEKSAAAWRGPAFTVGDIGRLDAGGYLYLDGRRDDLIITGGVNVYPAEVEAALADVEGVQELAAFGMPDERWGERVCLAVIGDASDAALASAARDRLAPYKRPKAVYRVAALPRTDTGKIRRSSIAASLGPD